MNLAERLQHDADVTAFLREQGAPEMISEGEASRLLLTFGFYRTPTSNPRRLTSLGNVGADLARRLREQETLAARKAQD